MSSAAPVSVVLPTHRRSHLLRQVITPLLEDPAVREVLVVVDGEDDGAAEVLDAMAAGDSRLQRLASPRRGGAAARQHGASCSTGDVVLFLDDDVVPGPGLATGHAAAHAGATEGEELVVVGYMPTATGEGGLERFATDLYAAEYEAMCRTYERDEAEVLRKLWGGNISVPRHLLEQVPYESADFTTTNHSDRDFGLRCLRRGARGVFLRELRAQHVHTRPLPQFLRDAYRQGAGRAQIHHHHPDLVGELDPSGTLRGLPAPLRLVVSLDHHEVVRRPLSAALLVLSRSSLALGSARGLSTGARLLRRLETRRGERDFLAGATARHEG
ncbi:glycosyltransferase family 2 protein [uncultured Pseudokineococcus sp.]|uniref:glycosyltransferase n=1 Tax=uncultured Pseudokineococcus sp. TaxID=1642928 RepID=UPI00261DAF48|nr:glycosyltransferase family 2 protein [uncultured Pseudokineococcus sp.]